MTRMRVKVDTHGLPTRMSMFTQVEAKRALRGAVRSGVGKGRTFVRAATPVKTGLSRAGIRSSTRTVGITAIGRIYPSGPHAHITRWQDQGTGDRHTKRGADRGAVEAQRMFERGAIYLDAEMGHLMNDYIDRAIAKSGLGA